MEHVAKLKGRRVADIESKEGDLPGHIITSYSQGTDTLRIVFDRRNWSGYEKYSVIFWRADDDLAPHKEYELDYDNPTVKIPGSLTQTPGVLRFAVKALNPSTGKRLMSSDDNTRLQVIGSGAVDGSPGNEDELTELEEALEQAKTIEPKVKQLEDTIEKARDTLDRAEGIVTLDYSKASNKPSISDHVLVGNSDLDDIGITTVKNTDIFELLKGW